MVIMVILLIIVKIKYIKLSKKSLFFCVLFFPKEHVDAVFPTLFAWVERAKGEGGGGEGVRQRGTWAETQWIHFKIAHLPLSFFFLVYSLAIRYSIILNLIFSSLKYLYL